MGIAEVAQHVKKVGSALLQGGGGTGKPEQGQPLIWLYRVCLQRLISESNQHDQIQLLSQVVRLLPGVSCPSHLASKSLQQFVPGIWDDSFELSF